MNDHEQYIKKIAEAQQRTSAQKHPNNSDVLPTKLQTNNFFVVFSQDIQNKMT